jgi:uncharacterized protein (TIGR01777 family)
METILITGGTGLIGKHLTLLLQQEGYEVIHVSRNKHSTGVKTFQWDVEKLTIDDDAIAAADHVVHLAGANVAEGRWTPRYKREIVNSRVQSTALLYESIKRTPNRIKSIVSASAIGYYGNRGEEWLKEESPPAHDFLGETCIQWEAAVQHLLNLGKRVVMLRTGLVLAKEGGALPPLLQPISMGIAPLFGNGEQFYSPIHIDDVCAMYMSVIRNEKAAGPFNAVAPAPVRYKDFVNAIAKAAGKKKMNVPVPMPLLKIVKGEFVETLAYSARCSSQKIESTGFTFKYPTVTEALAALI